MLPKRLRIQKKNFPTGAGGSKTLSGAYFSLRLSPAQTKGGACVVVSGKISKKAVVRNRIKRVVYAVLASYKNTNIFKKYNTVFYARKESVPAKNKDLRSDIANLVKRTNITQ